MKQQRMLVEGNDFYLILEVCMKHRLKRPVGFSDRKDFEEKFVIKSKRGAALGKNDLVSGIDDVVRSADIYAVGIVIDADTSVASTWQSICASLQKSGYTGCPPNPDSNGTVIIDSNPDLPKIGIWIMPDNENPGEIEDFFLRMIPADNPLLTKAQSVVRELIEQNHLKDAVCSKAETHSWLAWQQDPGKSMGVAIRNNWVDTKTDLSQKFAQWFERLFELETE